MTTINGRIGGLTSVVTLIALVAQFGLNRVAEWGDGSNFPPWAPTFGTFGETRVLYSLGVEIASPLLLILLALGLGYRAGRRIDPAHEYREFATSVVVGSTLVVAGWTSLTWYVGASVSNGFDVFLVLASFASTFVSTTLVITVGALAGAALVHFQTKASPPTQPGTAKADDSEPRTDHTG